MSVLRGFFLAFAIWGAIYPIVYSGGWFSSDGTSPAVLLGIWLGDATVESVSWDLLISAIVLTVWALAETYVRKNWIALIGILATWTVGLGCGLPLYLFLRTAAPR